MHNNIIFQIALYGLFPHLCAMDPQEKYDSAMVYTATTAPGIKSKVGFSPILLPETTPLMAITYDSKTKTNCLEHYMHIDEDFFRALLHMTAGSEKVGITMQVAKNEIRSYSINSCAILSCAQDKLTEATKNSGGNKYIKTISMEPKGLSSSSWIEFPFPLNPFGGAALKNDRFQEGLSLGQEELRILARLLGASKQGIQFTISAKNPKLPIYGVNSNQDYNLFLPKGNMTTIGRILNEKQQLWYVYLFSLPAIVAAIYYQWLSQ